MYSPEKISELVDPLKRVGLEVAVRDGFLYVSSLSLSKKNLGSWELLLRCADVTNIDNEEGVFHVVTKNYIYRIDYRWNPPVFHLNPCVSDDATK